MNGMVVCRSQYTQLFFIRNWFYTRNQGLEFTWYYNIVILNNRKRKFKKPSAHVAKFLIIFFKKKKIEWSWFTRSAGVKITDRKRMFFGWHRERVFNPRYCKGTASRVKHSLLCQPVKINLYNNKFTVCNPHTRNTGERMSMGEPTIVCSIS